MNMYLKISFKCKYAQNGDTNMKSQSKYQNVMIDTGINTLYAKKYDF